MRYLQDGVGEQLVSVQEKLSEGAQVHNAQLTVAKLRKQVEGFMEFEYAQMAIYLYEEIDLAAVFSDVLQEFAPQMDAAGGQAGRRLWQG